MSKISVAIRKGWVRSKRLPASHPPFSIPTALSRQLGTVSDRGRWARGAAAFWARGGWAPRRPRGCLRPWGRGTDRLLSFLICATHNEGGSHALYSHGKYGDASECPTRPVPPSPILTTHRPLHLSTSMETPKVPFSPPTDPSTSACHDRPPRSHSHHPPTPPPQHVTRDPQGPILTTHRPLHLGTSTETPEVPFSPPTNPSTLAHHWRPPRSHSHHPPTPPPWHVTGDPQGPILTTHRLLHLGTSTETPEVPLSPPTDPSTLARHWRPPRSHSHHPLTPPPWHVNRDPRGPILATHRPLHLGTSLETTEVPFSPPTDPSAKFQVQCAWTCASAWRLLAVPAEPAASLRHRWAQGRAPARGGRRRGRGAAQANNPNYCESIDRARLAVSLQIYQIMERIE